LLVHCWCGVGQIGLQWLAKLCNFNITERINSCHWYIQYEINFFLIFNRNYTYDYNKLYIYHEYINYKLKLFFHKVSFTSNTIFPTWFSRYVPVVQNSLLKRRSSSRTMRFQLVGVRRTASSYCILQGTKIMEIECAKL